MNINFKHVWIVLKKELKDAFRDRKALLVNIILPMLFIPVIFIIASVAAKSAYEVKPEKTHICVIGKENSKQIVLMLEKSEFQIVDVDNPKKQLQDGKIKAILVIPKDFENSLLQEKQTSIQILTNEADMKSSNVGNILSNMINEYSKQIVKQRLVSKNLDPSIIEPIVIKKENVAPPKKQSATFLAFLIPMFLTLWAALGGMNAAIDITAGEKERGTLEPLLTTAATRTSIVTGKYLAVSIMALLAGLSSLIGVIVSFVLLPTALGEGFKNTPFSGYSVSPITVLIMLLVVILTAIIFAAIEVAIAAYARSFKEGQTYLSPISIIVVIPPYLTMYKMPNELTNTYFVLPLVNAISVLKELIYDIVNLEHLGLFIISSLVYIIISIKFAARMFENEKVLFRN
ncbi:ABC transporter permease [Caldicellulosiruptor acetigenus]|uniref:ABC transporter permease n=1 Tax=Caldicellulosiruptor acetigenus TaxID=301953 RepID=UPI0004050979|nr:ABC transporter permease [Caldicellulosiruptor acetigenus]WAM36376.1 ABC transporter permease [Caldicellulosiruptor acetigenus]